MHAADEFPYPGVCLRARDLSGGAPIADVVADTLSRAELRDSVSIVCPEPIDHFLSFAALHRIAAILCADAPQVRLVIALRSALEDWTAFRHLGAAELVRLPATFSLGLDVSGIRAALGCRGIVLLGHSRPWLVLLKLLSMSARGRVLVLPSWKTGPFPSATLSAASAFLQCLQRESPLWTTSEGTRPFAPLPLRPHVLVTPGYAHLGDTLWLTPGLRWLRSRIPLVRISAAADGIAADVLLRSGYVDEVVSTDRIDFGGVDAALFTFARAKGAALARRAAAAGVPRRINAEFQQFARRPADAPHPFTDEAWFFWGALPAPRVFLSMIERLLGKEEVNHSIDWTPCFHPEPEEDEAGRQWLKARGLSDKPFVVLAPGAIASPAWPADRFAELGRGLALDYGAGLVIAGSPSESSLLHDVRDRIAAASGHVAVLKEPLGTFGAILRRARLLVANDSGSIHLAHALGVPSLYFSPHRNLMYSHPQTLTACALFDDVEDCVANITVDCAREAVEHVQKPR